MRGKELIAEELPVLNHTDKGEYALQIMTDLKVAHLSVLKNNNFVGVVSENDLLNYSPDELSKPLTQLFDHLPRPYVLDSAHIFEVLKLAAIDHLSTIPVLNNKEEYLGSISLSHLTYTLSKTASINEQGSIIVLEMSTIDYSLAQIAQIIESDNGKIISSFVSSNSSSKKLELTLKINKKDVGRIIRALERYDYHIKDSYQNDSYRDDIRDRYDGLMNYLNI